MPPTLWLVLRQNMRKPAEIFPLSHTDAFLLRSMAMGRYQGDDTTGFQSPAQDYVEPVIDLAAMLELRRPELHAVRVVGQGLKSRGIHDGDILVTNTAADPASGKVCVAFAHGEVVLATLSGGEDCWWLQPSGRDPIPVDGEVEVWAIVKALVRMKV